MEQSTEAPSQDPIASVVPRESLPRRLGIPGLVILLVAFNAPIAAMAGFQQLSIGFGNGAGAPVAFVVAGAILLLFAVGFVGMSKHVQSPGAYYRYVVEGLGRPAGFAAALLATVAYTALLPGSVIFLGLVLVDSSTQLFGEPIGSWQVLSLVSLAAVTVLALLRVDLSMKVIGALVIVECVVVAVWEFVIFVQGGPEGYSAASFSGSEIFSGSIGLAVIFAMLTMIGIEAPAAFRNEAKNPDRSVKISTFLGIGFLMVFYALGSWAYIISQGPSRVVDESINDPVGSFLTSIDTYIGSVFVHITMVVLVTSQLAATNAGLVVASRYLHALGRDRALPRQLAKVHPRLQSPHVAVLTVVAIGLVSVLLAIGSGISAVPAYAAMTGAGIYFLLPVFVLTSISVIVFFHQRPQHGVSRWATVVAPGLAAISLSVLFVMVTGKLEILTATRTASVLAMVGVVAVPVLGYVLALWYRTYRPEVFERIGGPLDD